MWFNFVLSIGILLFESVASDSITCKSIEISKETQNITVSFLHQYGDQFHNCVWLISENSSTSPKVQWMASVQITLSRYQNACANKTVRIISVENGDTKSTEIRLNEMRNIITKKMLLDLNTGVTINVIHGNSTDASTCVKQVKLKGYEISIAELDNKYSGMGRDATKTTHLVEDTSPHKPTTRPTTKTSARPSTTTKLTSRPTTKTSARPSTTTKLTSRLTTKTSARPSTITPPYPPTPPTRDTTWTPPNWPPSTNTITMDPPTTTSTESTTANTTLSEIVPTPPMPSSGDSERFQWQIISFVFIALAGLLLVVSIFLYWAMPSKRKPIEGTSFSIPRPNIKA